MGVPHARPGQLGAGFAHNAPHTVLVLNEICPTRPRARAGRQKRARRREGRGRRRRGVPRAELVEVLFDGRLRRELHGPLRKHQRHERGPALVGPVARLRRTGTRGARASTCRRCAKGEPADQFEGHVVDGVLGTKSATPELSLRGTSGSFHWFEGSSASALALGVLIVGFLVHAYLHVKQWHAVPESLVTVLIGVCLGIVLTFSPLLGEEGTLNSDLVRMIFSMVLNLAALPVIIFESGWSLRTRDFVSQFGYIMVFAILGTIASVVVVANLLLWTSSYHSIGDWRLAVAFASLISSVDPVSTLATFGHLNVDQLLFILVFGESQINDAVAITLFRSVNDEGLGSMLKLAGSMLWVFSGSVAVGVSLAMLVVLMFRFGKMGSSPAHAVLTIFVSCFFTFSVGELLSFSGIIAVLFNSIVMGSYAGVHLSSESMALTSFLLKQMSSLADTLIFLCSGVMGVFAVMSKGRGLKLGLFLSAFCLLARVVSVFPLGFLSNLIKRCVGKHLPKERDHMISWRHLVMMWHSGLRGGISLVLVTELGDWVDPAIKSEMLDATFVMVVLYLLVFGSSTGLMLKCLGLPMGDQVDETATLYTESDRNGWPWRMMMFTHERVMLPLLLGNSRGKEDDEDSIEGVVLAALRGAREGERGADDGPSPPQFARRSSTKNVLLDLFGTADPTHSLDCDVGDLRNRRVSDPSLDSFSDSTSCCGALASDMSASEDAPGSGVPPPLNTVKSDDERATAAHTT
mmetsp:Transcript_121607/g.340518  ORF Transcript_121607/g.340518 Transcript_121607/m.340518 type:complete len:747 (+) Transcript_121607:106-2346(+)